MSEIGFGVHFTILTQDEMQPPDKLLRSAKGAGKSVAHLTPQKSSTPASA